MQVFFGSGVWVCGTRNSKISIGVIKSLPLQNMAKAQKSTAKEETQNLDVARILIASYN
jgi:hypothetical protein